jgi:hypothetical protein
LFSSYSIFISLELFIFYFYAYFEGLNFDRTADSAILDLNGCI